MRLDPGWGGVVVTGLTLTHLMPVCLFSPFPLSLPQVSGKRRNGNIRIHYLSELCAALTRDLFVWLPPEFIYFLGFGVRKRRSKVSYPFPTAQEIRGIFTREGGVNWKLGFQGAFLLPLLLLHLAMGEMKEDDLWWAWRCQELAESLHKFCAYCRSRSSYQVQKRADSLKRGHFAAPRSKPLPRETGWFFKTNWLDCL